MRFWITRNSELPIREQLVKQVVLAILSEDLPPGQRLPSVRALARRHHIHSNTVSAAYHQLLERGWLELRRGSGLYVRPVLPLSDGEAKLDVLLTAFLRTARSHGYEPEDCLHRLDYLVHPRECKRILIAERDPGLGAILQAEIAEHINVPVQPFEPENEEQSHSLETSLVVALNTSGRQVQQNLPRGVLCLTLRLRSVQNAIEGNARPGPKSLIAIVSYSAEIRLWARAMLIAVGLDPECLYEVDPADDNLNDRIGLVSLLVTDVIAARQLQPQERVRVFRVISDSSLVQIKSLCKP